MSAERIVGVLVEFDGVVANTAAARRSAFGLILREHDIALTDAEYWETCAGWPTGDAVRTLARQFRLALDATAIDLLALRIDREYSSQVGKGVVLAEGARQALDRMAARARLAAVTRLRRADMQVLLSLARLEHVFGFVIGEEDAHPPKPDPAPYQAALRRLDRFRGGQPGRVIALENGVAGIRSARAAGLPCIAVGEQPAHVAMEADAYVPAMTDLDLTALATLLESGGTA